MVVKGWRKREKKEHFAKEGAGHLTQSMVFKLVKYSIWTQLVQLFIKWCDFGNTFAYILIWQVKAVSHTLFRELSAIMTGKGRVEIGGGPWTFLRSKGGLSKLLAFNGGHCENVCAIFQDCMHVNIVVWPLRRGTRKIFLAWQVGPQIK